jgi:hypothetical protein
LRIQSAPAQHPSSFSNAELESCYPAKWLPSGFNAREKRGESFSHGRVRENRGSVKRQERTTRSRVVRFPPARFSRMSRKSPTETCVNWGLPAHSPMAHTFRVVWCEQKSVCTSYCGSPGGKITSRIHGIVDAVHRVDQQCQVPLPPVISCSYSRVLYAFGFDGA